MTQTNKQENMTLIAVKIYI